MSKLLNRIWNWIKSLFIKDKPKEYFPFIKSSQQKVKTFVSKIPCQYCNQPMNKSIGQIVYFHRSCRTKGRNRNAIYA